MCVLRNVCVAVPVPAAAVSVNAVQALAKERKKEK